MRDQGLRWAIAGLALFGTVATGMLIGEEASADIAPLHRTMAIVPEHGRATDLAVALADQSAGSTDPTDASGGQGVQNATY